MLALLINHHRPQIETDQGGLIQSNVNKQRGPLSSLVVQRSASDTPSLSLLTLDSSSSMPWEFFDVRTVSSIAQPPRENFSHKQTSSVSVAYTLLGGFVVIVSFIYGNFP